MNIQKTVTRILQALLIAQFSFFGISKIIGTADMVHTFQNLIQYPSWFRVVVGIVEVTAVVLLIVAFKKQNLMVWGSLLIGILTLGAAYSHAFRQGSMPDAIIPLVVFAQMSLMLWLNQRVAQQPAEHPAIISA